MTKVLSEYLIAELNVTHALFDQSFSKAVQKMSFLLLTMSFN